MKICILTPRFPFPENGGDVLRINNVARYLKAQGHSLCLVSFAPRKPDLSEATELYDSVYCVTFSKLKAYFYSLIYFILHKPMQCGYYHSATYMRVLREVIEKEHPDKYVAHLLRMTPYLEELSLQQDSIIEMTDALSKTYALVENAKGGGLLKWIYKFEQRRILRYEMWVTNTFPRVVLVSQKDVDYLQALCPLAQSLVFKTNGTKSLPTFPTTYDANKICFMGNMRTLQNQDAVLNFVHNVFPLILQHQPNATFYIIGSEPPTRIKALASEHVVLTGFVADVQKVIQDACVMVAMVSIAAGIQNKVLVAMGCGVPVVLTSLIAQAIPELKNAENALVANEPTEIAHAVLDLMANQEKRNAIGLAGYQMVKQHYTWEAKLINYEQLWKNKTNIICPSNGQK